MDKADCIALKTLAREQEFAKAIQIFLNKRGTEEIIIPAVSAPLREMLWNYEVGPDLTLMLF